MIIWRGGGKHFRGNPCRQLARSFAGEAEALLSSLLDHEKQGVPQNAGKEGLDGFDLQQMRQLLSDMEEPQQKLKTVHIAGTKGKGSTATMLSSILQQSGMKVGTYTSPHITSINERIAVNLEPISTEGLDSLAKKWQPVIAAANKRGPKALTHFEVLTALMLAHFAEQQVDIAVVETGLGGIRDATNVFGAQQLLLAIITALGLEHQGALGKTLGEIAAAKAGICKKMRPLLIGPQPSQEATDLLRQEADAAGSPCQLSSEIVQAKAGPIILSKETAYQDFSFRAASVDNPMFQEFGVSSKLIGDHQAGNAETAVAAAVQLQSQGFAQITESSIAEGLETACLAGRFQVSKLGSDKPWLVLDGAHTLASAAALAKTLEQTFKDLPIGFVVAMADDKDHAGFLAALRNVRPHVVTFTEVRIAGGLSRSAPPGMLAGHWQAASFDEDKPLRCRELMKTNMASAMEISQRELFFATSNAVICVTGSLHAVSAAKDYVQESLLS